MSGLTKPHDYVQKPISSYDGTGGNDDAQPIPAGDTFTLLDEADPGVITHVWMTIASGEMYHLKKLVLRAYWDGEESPSVTSFMVHAPSADRIATQEHETGAPGVAGLTLTFDAREIAFKDTPEGENCELDFLFIQRDHRGKQLAGEEKRAEVNVSTQKYGAFLQDGMLVTNHLELAEGATLLKIAVRDRRSGAMGSLSIPLLVK